MSWVSSAERIRGPAKKNAIDFSHGMEAKHTMNVHVSWVSSAERVHGPAKMQLTSASVWKAKHTRNVQVSWVSSAERIRGPAKNAIDFSLSMEVKTYKERAHVVGQ